MAKGRRTLKMAEELEISSEVDVELEQVPGTSASGSKVVVLKKKVWDPFSSPDWDNEKHTKEALIRIKRYFLYPHNLAYVCTHPLLILVYKGSANNLFRPPSWNMCGATQG